MFMLQLVSCNILFIIRNSGKCVRFYVISDVIQSQRPDVNTKDLLYLVGQVSGNLKVFIKA